MAPERALRRIQREKKFAHSNLTCQMQDRVRAFRAFLQDLDSFGRRQYLELDFTATSLAVNLFHHWQRSGSSADHKPPALPGYLLLYRERCMPKPIAEPFGRFFLALVAAPHSGTRRNIGHQGVEASDQQGPVWSCV